MKKLKGNMRRAKIDDCAWLPNETADFYITNMGIFDDEIILENISKPDQKTEKEEIEEPVSSPMMAGLKEIADIKKEETKEKTAKKATTKKTSKKSATQPEKQEDVEIQKETLQDLEADLVALEEISTKNTKKEKPKTKSSGKKSKIPA